MTRIAAFAFLALALAGCAPEGGYPPSYLGLADVAAKDNAPSPTQQPSDAARHIQSNKVLGAMAFQKVTGRTVAPERLSDSK